jgi:GT2 family glycosyltransferase
MAAMAVAVVNFNAREWLRACLLSIARESAVRKVVSDNGSTDGSIELVRASFAWAELDVDFGNRGYGAAANRAMRRCREEYVLLLNSDTELDPGTLRALTAYLDAHPRAAIVGPRVLNTDRTLQASCFPFPSPLTAFLSETEVGYLIRFVPGVRSRYLRTWPHDASRTVPWVRGAALAIRRSAFESLGGFDERFYMYFEEVDLCYRAAAAGWEVHFTPDATLVHHGGVSTRQYRAEMLAHYYESLFRFYRHHYPAARLRRLRSVLGPIALARLGRDRVRLALARAEGTRRRLAADVALWRDLWRHSREAAMAGHG